MRAFRVIVDAHNRHASRADIGVAAGTLNISVAYQGLPIYSEVRDLCDMTTCPIQKGDLLIAYDQYLPPIVPPVSVPSLRRP